MSDRQYKRQYCKDTDQAPCGGGQDGHPGPGCWSYQRHRSEQTLIYRIVEEYYPAFTTHLAEQGRELPGYVKRGFEDDLKCGRLEHGFVWMRCESCHAEHLVEFSCKRRGFSLSCGARRMAESAVLLVDEVLPGQPMRQGMLSFPFPLRFLFASRPEIMGRVLGIVYRVNATRLIKKAGHGHATDRTGAVILIQRIDGVLNLNIHYHMLFLDGMYVEHPHGSVRFCRVKALSSQELTQLVPAMTYRVSRFLERQGLLERDAENSKHRVLVTPARRDRGTNRNEADQERIFAERRASMSWAQRLKRVSKLSSRPARPAVGRCGSLPVSRIRW